MTRLLATLLASLVTTASAAASGLAPGGYTEFDVELPADLRRIAGRGELSPVSRALVTVAVPADFDMARA
ncbi:MAG: hypothetical protein IPH30_02045 [Betaproteobacteria bacterium]|nr:hypothetical protein [Betaproteobacteria bacterium]